MNHEARALIGASVRRACSTWPRMATALLSLKPVEKPGIETVAVDPAMRLYYDPEFVLSQPADRVVYLILSETTRPVLGHHTRGKRLLENIPGPFKKLAQEYIGIASDIAVHTVMGDARALDHCLAVNTCGKFGGKPDACFEENFSSLFPWEVLDQDLPDGDEQGGDGDEEGEGQPGGGGQPQGQEGEGEGDGQGESEGDGQGESEGDGQGQGQPSPDTSGLKRGSGADGQPREWEDPVPERKFGQPSTECIGETDLEKMREIAWDGGHGKGTGGAEWRRAQTKPDDPGCSPEKLLRTALCRIAENLRLGGQKRSFRRLSRRPVTTKCLRPASFTPRPRIAVLIDTSGSMSDRELRQALGIVQRVMQRMHLSTVRVVCADGYIESDQQVNKISKIRMDGGGGTRMDSVLVELDREPKRTRPEAVLCVTDGETDWPSMPLSFPLVIASTRKSQYWPTPDWAKVVHTQYAG